MQEESTHAQYSIYRRKSSSSFYIQYWNPQLKKYGQGRSSGKTKRRDAERVAQEWLATYGGLPPLVKRQHDSLKEKVNYYLSQYMEAQGLLEQGQTYDIDQILQKASLKAGPDEQDEKNPIFVEYLISFWDWDTSEYIQEKLEAGQRIGKPYCNANKSYIKKYVAPYFKELRLQSINVKILKEFKAHFIRFSPEHPEGLKLKTIRDIMGCISKALDEAAKSDSIPFNPSKCLLKVAVPKKHREILTTKEVAKVFLLDWPDVRSKLASQLAASHGMRAGEIAGLRIEQLNFKRNTIDINKSWQRQERKLKGTKTDKNRLVYTDPYLLEKLKDLYSKNPFNNGFIFWDPEKEDQPMSPDLFLDHLRTALVKIGISKEDQTSRGLDFQAWRHFCNSTYRGSIPDKVLQNEIGHSSDEMTDYYYHLTEEQGEHYRATYSEILLPLIFSEKPLT